MFIKYRVSIKRQVWLKMTKKEILEFLSTSMPEMKEITEGAQEIWSSRRKCLYIEIM